MLPLTTARIARQKLADEIARAAIAVASAEVGDGFAVTPLKVWPGREYSSCLVVGYARGFLAARQQAPR